ncbi:universal stress protein [Ramlibacter sp. RBP-2]|uniref:Universal stress protein n=1 Tax=Ramlibacter lithotrophicus TaxID=2606681 RepID=A0A7X6I6Z0_9BURK|nr:universal stress protein [Ramlibacter lithotrophicus]NKE66801.1 universal stress protein [Ramlibacter lithotrophicus]
MKILLAVDGSDYTGKMLDYVTRQPLFDQQHDYTLFNAQPPLPPHAASAVGAGATRDYHQDEARKVLEPALARLRDGGYHAATEWRTGSAGETIARFAADGGYDLVVMGTHGYGALGRLIMGSVATQVLANGTVPVLLIP